MAHSHVKYSTVWFGSRDKHIPYKNGFKVLSKSYIPILFIQAKILKINMPSHSRIASETGVQLLNILFCYS